MLVAGVDENGLGPRLGPLVATALTLDSGSRYARAALCERGLALGLTDSKETGGFGRMGFTESVALALVEHVWGGPIRSTDAFLSKLCAEPRPSLRAFCPDERTASQCWSIDPALPMFGGDAAHGRALLERLVGRSKLRIVDVRSGIACAGMLNARLADGRNKLAVDLELFEHLLSGAQNRLGAPMLALCGMVGGIRDYAPRFSRFKPDSVSDLGGPRTRRAYSIRGFGEVRFEVDADARHLPVALASIVGKYVRELCMHRIGAFYQSLSPGLRLASGYHDPVTTGFIEATKPHRRRLAIATDCFTRRA